jgi:cephalosporin hydroxylase
MTKNTLTKFFKKNQISEFYQLSNEVAFRKSDDKIVALLFNEDESIFEIDGIAIDIFDAISKKESLINKMIALQDGKNWDSNHFQEDVLAFLNQLIEHKIIEAI